MTPEHLKAEISKLNVSQRAAMRKLVPSVRASAGDVVTIYKATKGAHVYVRLGNKLIISALLGPRGRVNGLKRVAA